MVRCYTRLSLYVVSALLCWPLLVHAQGNFPTRPIRIISPFALGGSTSTIARVIGQKLTESWGQQIIVDNRPGGNTIIGADTLAKASPDGYSYILTTNTHIINPSLFPKLPYEPIRDFSPVGMVYSSEFVLVITSGLAANNLQELIALARAKPGQLNYATTGAGGSSHLANVLLGMQTGVQIQHIPYKGAGPALVDLIGGQVHMFMNNPLTVIAHIRSGRIKGIAVTGTARVPALPQVPTFTEGGVPGIDVNPWFCLLAPAGTPKPIINKVSTEVTRIMALPDVLDYLAKQGMSAYTSTPEQLDARMKGDMARWAKVIKAANIKIDI